MRNPGASQISQRRTCLQVKPGKSVRDKGKRGAKEKEVWTTEVWTASNWKENTSWHNKENWREYTERWERIYSGETQPENRTTLKTDKWNRLMMPIAARITKGQAKTTGSTFLWIYNHPISLLSLFILLEISRSRSFRIIFMFSCSLDIFRARFRSHQYKLTLLSIGGWFEFYPSLTNRNICGFLTETLQKISWEITLKAYAGTNKTSWKCLHEILWFWMCLLKLYVDIIKWNEAIDAEPKLLNRTPNESLWHTLATACK